MKKLLKVVGVLAVAAVVVLGALSVAVKVFLPPEKAKALVEKQVAEHLHREMRLGSISVGLLSGLDLSNFELSESPNFSKGTFVSAERFVIQPRLWPLLKKEVLVKEIILTKPTITVTRSHDGKTYNFSDLMPANNSPSASSPAPALSAPAPAPAPTQSSSSALSFLVSNARVDDGHLTFVDQSPAGMSAEIRDLNLRVSNITLAGSINLESSLIFAAKGLEAQAEVNVAVNILDASAQIKKARISAGSSSVSVSGTASHLRSDDPSVDLTLTLAHFEPRQWAAFAPLPASVKLNGPLSADATLKGTGNDLSFTLTSNFTPMDMSLASSFLKPAGVPLVVAASGSVKDKANLQLDAAQISLSSFTITAKGSVTNLASDNRRMKLTVASNDLSVGGLAHFLPAAALPSAVRLAGPLKFSVDVDGTANAGQLQLKTDVTDMDVRYADDFHKPAGVPLMIEAAGPFTAAPSVNATALSITLADLKLTGQASFKSAQSSIYNATLKSNTFALDSVAKLVPMLADYSLAGPMELTNVRVGSAASGSTAAGALTLKGVSAHYAKSELTQLSGPVEFTMDSVNVSGLKGKLNGADMNIKVSAKNVETHPVVVANLDFQELDLSKLIPDDKTKPGAGQKTERSEPRSSQWAWVAEAEAASPPAAAPGFMDRPMDLSGTLTVAHIKHDYYSGDNLNLKWNVTGVTQALDKINGTATLRHGKGEVSNLQKLTADSKAAKVLFLPLSLLQKLDKASGGQMHLPSMDNFPFKDITGDYRFKSGSMDVTSFNLDSDTLSAALTGSVGLVGTQPLDMKAVIKLAAGVGGAVAQIFQDSQGRATFNVTIKGTATSPSVSLNKQETGKQVINSFLHQLGLPGGQTSGGSSAQNASPSAPATSNSSGNSSSSGDSNQSNAAQNVQKLLKGLFSK